jgi:hypothetical protein
MQPSVLKATKKYLDFALVEDYPLRFSKAKGRRVQCLSGKVWITACNELPDYMLTPGEVFIIPNNGLTLIEAIGDCRVRIDLPHLFIHVLHRLLVLGGWDRVRQALGKLRGLSYMLRL